MLRLVDDVMDLGERGIALLWMEAEGETIPHAGMKLRDAKGNVHAVTDVACDEGVYTLLIPEGNADYFGRLFRNVFLDACVFEEVE